MCGWAMGVRWIVDTQSTGEAEELSQGFHRLPACVSAPHRCEVSISLIVWLRVGARMLGGQEKLLVGLFVLV